MPESGSSRTLISLGANLGHAKQTIEDAAEAIFKQFGRRNVIFSRLYKTAAVGGPLGQEDFFNAVALIESNDSAFGVWQFLHQTEKTLGRHRLKRWEARRIDLDVLLHETQSEVSKEYSSEIIWTPTFKVPHPRMTMRTFVLTPACDVAKDMIEPVTEQALEKLSQRLDFLAHDRRSPTILLSCDSDETVGLMIQSLQRSIPLTDRIARSTSSTQHQYFPRILSCTLPKLTAAKPVTMSTLNSVRTVLSNWLDDARSSCPSIQFDHWIHACRSPDPSISHWEDFCRPWADAFGMTSHQDEKLLSQYNNGSLEYLRDTPTYLLAANDLEWAAHELKAATEAMTCPIQPCGSL